MPSGQRRICRSARIGFVTRRSESGPLALDLVRAVGERALKTRPSRFALQLCPVSLSRVLTGVQGQPWDCVSSLGTCTSSLAPDAPAVSKRRQDGTLKWHCKLGLGKVSSTTTCRASGTRIPPPPSPPNRRKMACRRYICASGRPTPASSLGLTAQVCQPSRRRYVPVRACRVCERGNVPGRKPDLSNVRFMHRLGPNHSYICVLCAPNTHLLLCDRYVGRHDLLSRPVRSS